MDPRLLKLVAPVAVVLAFAAGIGGTLMLTSWPDRAQGESAAENPVEGQAEGEPVVPSGASALPPDFSALVREEIVSAADFVGSLAQEGASLIERCGGSIPAPLYVLEPQLHGSREAAESAYECNEAADRILSELSRSQLGNAIGALPPEPGAALRFAAREIEACLEERGRPARCTSAITAVTAVLDRYGREERASRIGGALGLLGAAPLGRDELSVHGVGTVTVGMTPSEAEAAWGEEWEGSTHDVSGLPLDDPRLDPSCHYAGPVDHDFSFIVEEGRLTAMSTSSRRFVTAEGIRVGSPESGVRAAYDGRLEERANVYTDEPILTYAPRGAAEAHLRMVFYIEAGYVASIKVGRLPSVEYSEGCL